ncbi:hypothetical protein [Actinacidiphila sp. ITFR-21]|uniref:hypothetical protein n=1 Tax=Actinacidiphila sp. ITFR-21 TaxID=3075199 RepID=UPI002889B0C0|nr:hypothetical protein [Streptomyces sp. ITFR-21]WNI19368.1 hypothetical protein RLT57_30035 [Streptomyces sp. ITFR-21]
MRRSPLGPCAVPPLALVLLAVCAATGCTTVSARTAPPPAPGSSATGSSAGQQPGHGDGRSSVVGPARKAMGTTETKPSATPRTPVHRSPRQARRPAPAPLAPRRGTLPSVIPVPTGSAVCALGEQYGGWAPGSDAAAICHRQYGG